MEFVERPRKAAPEEALLAVGSVAETLRDELSEVSELVERLIEQLCTSSRTAGRRIAGRNSYSCLRLTFYSIASLAASLLR